MKLQLLSFCCIILSVVHTGTSQERLCRDCDLSSREFETVFDSTVRDIENRNRQVDQLFREADQLIREDEGHQKLLLQVSGSTEDRESTARFPREQVCVEATANVSSQAGISSALFTEEGRLNRRARISQTTSRALGFITEAHHKTCGCVWDFWVSKPCPTTPWRTANGHCNNLVHKTWGQANTAFGRKLAPSYEGGSLDNVRRTNHFTVGLMNNPRVISETVTEIAPPVLDDLGFSNHIMQWGQFIAHEITAIKESQPGAACCKGGSGFGPWGTGGSGTAHRRNCIEIVYNNDPKLGSGCMNQLRSAAVPLVGCEPGPRQQTNTATHFIDASAVYGSNLFTTMSLRTPLDGKLKTQNYLSKTLLPVDPTATCDDSPKCPFAAGDRRVNTTPNLVSTHYLFVCKHNKIAQQLKTLNPHWDGERIFQEARRIIGAIQQNIHYNEWLQHLLDDKLGKYDLNPTPSSGFRNTYNPTTNPSLLNELAGSALRFGHSTVGGQFTANSAPNALLNNFNNPSLIYNQGVSGCLRGLGIDSPWKHDKFFDTSMRDRLFNRKLDIVALNLNRGRDHGFDSYAAYRKTYTTPITNSWTNPNLVATHTPDVIAALKLVYATPLDIELFIGAMTETKLYNGYIGPLNAEILGDAFRRLRDGDRFYFEGKDSGLTLDQINSIRSYKYSDLICECGGLEEMPDDAFRQAGPGNQNKNCSCGRNKINLQLWQKQKCEWRDQYIRQCCGGFQSVTRRCVNIATGASCNKCSGPATIQRPCRCASRISCLCEQPAVFETREAQSISLSPQRRLVAQGN